MSQRTKTLDRGGDLEVSTAEGTLDSENKSPVPKEGELRPLARALIDLAISLREEEEESDR